MSQVKTMAAGEFKAKCLEVMDRVSATGETIVLTKRGKPVAQLSPVVAKPDSLFGFLRGEIQSTGDLIAPVDEHWDAETE
jgi:prevent-host-death family protein